MDGYLLYNTQTRPCCAVTLQAVDAVGEILLSLSYLPTAERLTVVVAKCKNLVWTNNKTTAGQTRLSVCSCVCRRDLHECVGYFPFR